VEPRLAVVAGPLKDSAVALSNNEFPIGRDPSNLLSISDPSMSRRHCVIKRDGERFKIRDLDSRNGTFVNGSAVKNESWLEHGDQISVGDSVFVLQLNEDGEEPAGGKVEFDDVITHATAQLRPQDVLYLHPDKIQNQLPATSRLARNLNALLKISRVVHAIRDLEQLQTQILDLIFEVSPAERGAILLDGKGGDQFSSVFTRYRLAASSQPVRVSRTIARRVLEEGVAILGADVPASGGLNVVESLVVSNVCSLLCVPLTVFQKVIGCIYLDTTSGAGRFDEDHLQLAAAIAGICAVALENARRQQWLEQENLRLSTEINLEHNMVGDSPRIREVYQLLSRAAPTDSTVLIEGESGTGKELAARALHRNSPRSGRPFVAINCAAIPADLLETELFGHERGAFTGAVTQKKGRLEVADGGTVFLDEIGELAPALQVKLLRVLQEREFERVGGTRPISVDIRLVAATNRDLGEAVKAKTFRQDLYFRLNVVSLVMPPLRERREDIPMLAGYFVDKHSKKCKVKAKTFSEEAMACLVHYDWPGNVRELENAIERALVMSLSDVILPEDLPESLLEKHAPSGVAIAKYHAAVKDLKRKLIVGAVEEAKGNYTEAARLLGVHPNYLHRLIKNLDLKSEL
jgi:transcriptional regulator with GAF, ATPase, and Fis domain